MIRARPALLASSLALLCACATAGGEDPNPDPIEPANRASFAFNDTLDVYALAPAATGWTWITFEGLRVAIGRAMDNLSFPQRLVGNLFQGKLVNTASEIARFTLNSTAGLLGFFDPAAELGLGPHDEDFGQVLACWRVPAGPYLMIPLLGPSNPRDAVGQLVDSVLASGPVIASPIAGAILGAVDTINSRALLLQPMRDAKAGSLDYYVFVRDAYTQHRANQISNRQGPAESDDDDLYELEEDDE